MKTASLSEVQASLAAYVKASEEGPVVVTRNGKPVAVLRAVNGEEDLERLLMANSPRLQAILQRARRRIRAGKGIPAEQFWAEVEAEAAQKKGSRVKRRKAAVPAKK